MQQQPTPTLDYSHPPHRPRAVLAWQSLVAGVGAFVFIPSFMCTCGHLGVAALLATVPAGLLAWWGFTRPLSVIGRVVAGGVVVLVTLALAKNLMDIAWFGHDAMFR